MAIHEIEHGSVQRARSILEAMLLDPSWSIGSNEWYVVNGEGKYYNKTFKFARSKETGKTYKKAYDAFTGIIECQSSYNYQMRRYNLNEVLKDAYLINDDGLKFWIPHLHMVSGHGTIPLMFSDGTEIKLEDMDANELLRAMDAYDMADPDGAGYRRRSRCLIEALVIDKTLENPV